MNFSKVLLTLGLSVCAVNVSACFLDAPYGYTEEVLNKNLCIFKKNNENTRVFVVNLKEGAKINFLVEKASNSKEKLNNGNYDFYYKRKNIEEFLKYNSVVINGQFFDMRYGNKGFLSFPVKNRGSDIISEGPDMRLNGGGRTNWDFRSLVIKESYIEGSAAVKVYNPSHLKLNEKVIVGHRPDYNGPEIKEKQSIGRTYVGVRNLNSNAYSESFQEIVVFAVSESATTKKMRNVLKEWGVIERDMIMFDGSASSQYAFLNKKSNFNRKIPMAFGIYSY